MQTYTDAQIEPASNLNSPRQSNSTNNHLAELWFGCHPSGPSTVLVDGQCIKLSDFLAKHPEMVGEMDSYVKYNKKLPFLFKILSIDEPLSLQAHPDKKLAQILHGRDPKNYPDSNHKPELAIALTNFEVLCDFRPIEEISYFLKVYQPLRNLVDSKDYGKLITHASLDTSKDQLRQALANCFETLMTQKRDVLIREANNLLSDDLKATAPKKDGDLLNLIRYLNKIYPGDPGVFAPFFLNYLKLKPDQAIYLKANKLHAYLKGECIECMACSDNVVRAGLTTKFRDTGTLINMLDYETVSSAQQVLADGIASKSLCKGSTTLNIVTYSPTKDFKVDRISVIPKSDSSAEISLPSVRSGSFIVLLEGEATSQDFLDSKVIHKLALGWSGFIPPKVSPKLKDIRGTLVIYRAYC